MGKRHSRPVDLSGYNRKIHDLQRSNAQYQARLNKGEEMLKQSLDKANQLERRMQLPVEARNKKVAYVNGLKLKIRVTDKPCVLGPKGSGKTTWLYLLNQVLPIYLFRLVLALSCLSFCPFFIGFPSSCIPRDIHKAI